jgi:hypothetical protein
MQEAHTVNIPRYLLYVLSKRGGITMTICPVANSIGCEKCTIVNVCFLRSVFGNYGEEKPEQNSQDTTTSKSGSEPADT